MASFKIKGAKLNTSDLFQKNNVHPSGSSSSASGTINIKPSTWNNGKAKAASPVHPVEKVSSDVTFLNEVHVMVSNN